MNTKLGEDGLEVGFYRVLGQVQTLADAFIGEALRQEEKHIHLPWRQ
tara:strand:- start:705 stop:845 length:141 start_codon:yes stop_codon:yes gene_type:complete